MKDPVKYLKQAYKELLTGEITYNGTIVPVYDEESEPGNNDFYILVSTATATQLQNQKNRFNTECTILIDVVARLDYRISTPTVIVDSITDKVLQLVLPSISTCGVVGNDDFEVQLAALESSNHLPYAAAREKRIVRRVTRFSQTIIQK